MGSIPTHQVPTNVCVMNHIHFVSELGIYLQKKYVSIIAVVKVMLLPSLGLGDAV